jgi:hypothetical protein
LLVEQFHADEQCQGTLNLLNLAVNVLLQQTPTSDSLQVIAGMGVLHEIANDFPRLFDVTVRLVHVRPRN